MASRKVRTAGDTDPAQSGAIPPTKWHSVVIVSDRMSPAAPNGTDDSSPEPVHNGNMKVDGKEIANRIGANEESIVTEWTTRVMGSGIAFAQRPQEYVSASCRDGLRAIERVLRGSSVKLSGAGPALFGHGELMLGATQVDTVLAFLIGRQVIVDLVMPMLASEYHLDTSQVLNAALGKVVSLYGQATCTECMSRQDDRRAQVEQRLNSVIERSQDAIVLIDDQRVVQSWNQGAENLFGYAREEMIGQSLDRIVPDEVLASAEMRDVSRAVAARGHGRLLETRRAHKDGRHIWVDASFTAVANPSGTGQSVWVIFRDIGERKRLNEEILQSERLALIGTMSAKLAHEVRNPLTSIVLNLDLVQDSLRDMPEAEGAPGEVREMLGSIGLEVQRIQNVVEDYLRFARLPRLQLESTELDEMLRRHLPLVRTELTRRGVDLDLDFGAGAAQIMADEAQLWQGILNVVRNAMEAMPQGGRVQVSTRADSDRVTCAISDSGIGMDAETRDRIFRPFFSTKRGGTGLGLPLTQQVVAEHNGRLECWSEPGRGTRFTFSFNRARSSPGMTPQGRPEQNGGQIG